MVARIERNQDSPEDFREVVERAYFEVAAAFSRRVDELARRDEEFCRAHGITHVRLMSPQHNLPYY